MKHHSVCVVTVQPPAEEDGPPERPCLTCPQKPSAAKRGADKDKDDNERAAKKKKKGRAALPSHEPPVSVMETSK